MVQGAREGAAEEDGLQGEEQRSHAASTGIKPRQE